LEGRVGAREQQGKRPIKVRIGRIEVMAGREAAGTGKTERAGKAGRQLRLTTEAKEGGKKVVFRLAEEKKRAREMT
jgi:hypothetical protein